ncbi:MAG: DUF1947 domain-containing protein [Candidatus Bathyarchaeia archaeon]
MRRYFLKGREINNLTEKIPAPIVNYLAEKHLKRRVVVEVAELEGWKVYFFEGRPLLAETEDGKIFPTLGFTEVFSLLPRVIVDMGAVPHICNGADIMAPGVVKIDGEFGGDSLLIIIDEKNLKPIAIGWSIYPSKNMSMTRRGKVAVNVHYVGDKLWKALLSSGLS